MANARLPRLREYRCSFFLEVGLMEASEAQLETNRHMRDTLLAKGYAVHYQEFNGNHNYINWRGISEKGWLYYSGNEEEALLRRTSRPFTERKARS